MRLDHDLIRNLLFHIEEITDALEIYTVSNLYESYQEYSYTIFRYHIKYLYDIGFIEASNDFDDCIDKIEIIDITPLGRDFLDAIRDNTVWEKTKKKFQPLGSVAISVISDLATSFLRNKLGLGS